MTIEEIREKILTDDAFVLEELRKLQYLYGQQQVIRSNLTRTEDIMTESVAEHIYGLTVLAHYFSLLEELPELNLARVHELITWHDVDEIETGDTVAFLKTESHLNEAKAALDTVITKAPSILQTPVRDAQEEYKAQLTNEARFVKALDKIDPIFRFLNANGRKVFTVSPATKEQHCQVKEPYIKNYPYIKRFHEVTLPIFESEGYFSDQP
jgi:putative hydrolase of HD superfamily